MNHRHLCLIALSLCCFTPINAFAYQQTKTCIPNTAYPCADGQTPKGVHWPTRTVKYSIQRGGSPDFKANADGSINESLYQTIKKSFNTWNDVSCSDITFVEAGLVDRTELGLKCNADGTNDSINLILWPKDWAYSGSIYALTSVTFNTNNGVIFDADIEFNESFTYTNTDDITAIDVDVENTLTHEIGHFLGLDHEDTIEDATMYSMAPLGEIKKRDLHQDDIDGICAIYPKGVPATNEPAVKLCTATDGSDDGICSTTRKNSNTPMSTGALTLILFGLFIRRRRKK